MKIKYDRHELTTNTKTQATDLWQAHKEQNGVKHV